MKTLFKAFAALAATFTLAATPAFATEYRTLDGAKVYDCRLTGNSVGYKTEVLTEYTDEEVRGMAAAGLKPSSRKYWTPTTLQKCEDLLVKKTVPQKAVVAVANCEAAKENLAGNFSWQGWQQQTMNKECQNLELNKKSIKILGARPIVADPQKTIGYTEYCKDSTVHMYSVTLGKVLDVALSEKCQLDVTKTKTFKPILNIPGEPTDAEYRAAFKLLSGYDGYGQFCKNGKVRNVLAVTKNQGKTYQLSITADDATAGCNSSTDKFTLEPVHDEH